MLNVWGGLLHVEDRDALPFVFNIGNRWSPLMKTFKLSHFTAGIVITLSLFLPAALAEAANTTEADNNKTSTRTCFWLSQISDFRAIGNKHVWIKGVGNDDHYLLTLFSSCTGLRFAETVAFSTRPTQRLCNNANEHLILVDQGVANRSCIITTVERVENLNAARELVAERKAEKKQQEDAQD